MSIFYTLAGLTILSGVLLGYFTGFFKIIIFITQLILSFATADISTPVIARLLKNNFELQEELQKPVAFASIFLVCFIGAFFLFRRIKKYFTCINKNVLNKSIGGAAGLITAIISLLLFIQYTDIIAVPKNVQDKINEYGIAEAVNKPAEQVRKKFDFIFQQKPQQVITLDAGTSMVENGISLQYATTNFEIRPDLEQQMLQLINADRIKFGLKYLKPDAGLLKAARAHSADMFTRGYFSHYTPENIDPFQRLHSEHITYRYAGENLAIASSVIKAHEGLMNSPGHRANILSASYGKVGIGILDGGVHGLMVTQEFKN